MEYSNLVPDLYTFDSELDPRDALYDAIKYCIFFSKIYQGNWSGGAFHNMHLGLREYIQKNRGQMEKDILCAKMLLISENASYAINYKIDCRVEKSSNDLLNMIKLLLDFKIEDNRDIFKTNCDLSERLDCLVYLSDNRFRMLVDLRLSELFFSNVAYLVLYFFHSAMILEASIREESLAVPAIIEEISIKR